MVRPSGSDRASSRRGSLGAEEELSVNVAVASRMRTGRLGFLLERLLVAEMLMPRRARDPR